MLNLYDFYKQLENEKYCIVKNSNLLSYNQGEDIDIFCYNIKEIINVICHVGKTYVESQGYSIKITEVVVGKHVHVDFMFKKKIDYRFDLYGELPSYKKMNVRLGFFGSVIENAQILELGNNNEKVKVYVPCRIDDYIIRYLEYCEWYAVRPEKIKHINYIEENILENEKKAFWDKLHYYTELPEIKVKKMSFTKRFVNDLRWYWRTLKRMNVKSILLYLRGKMNEK